VSLPAAAPAVRGPAPELVELREGVHAYVQRPGGWCVSNAGIITGEDGAMVIDTLSTGARARRLAAAVDGLGPGPRRVVVNTHHHGDHNFGNHVFGPAATIVAHERARTEMAATGLALTGIWPDCDWGDAQVTLPTLTFTDRVAVHVGGRRAELIHPGPAHTFNDVVVWLPGERVLFAGDVVLNGAAPFYLFGTIAGGRAALARLADLGAETVVGGHGPVGGPELFAGTTAYLDRISQVATAGRAAGLTPLETAYEAGHGDFAHLIDAERLVGNLHVAFAEQAAADEGRPVVPVDAMGAFREMVVFNGGRLPTCLA
jgi:cyclase